jgi:maleate isomerase
LALSGGEADGISGPVRWMDVPRIALVVPGDCQVDDEFWRLLAPHAVPLVSRTTGATPSQLSMESAAIPHIVSLAESSDLEAAADRLRAVDPLAAAYVDTSISFIRGPGGDRDIAQRIASFLGVPVTVTSSAVVDACRALRVKRLAVLTVYVESVNARMVEFFELQGMAIGRMQTLTSSMGAGCTNRELARMQTDELIEAGRAIDGADIDAIFIPCTAVRTLEAIEPLEAATGKPVLTAIQATMWRVARLAGCRHATPLGGRLFALPDAVE